VLAVIYLVPLVVNLNRISNSNSGTTTGTMVIGRRVGGTTQQGGGVYLIPPIRT